MPHLADFLTYSRDGKQRSLSEIRARFLERFSPPNNIGVQNEEQQAEGQLIAQPSDADYHGVRRLVWIKGCFEAFNAVEHCAQEAQDCKGYIDKMLAEVHQPSVMFERCMSVVLEAPPVRVPRATCMDQETILREQESICMDQETIPMEQESIYMDQETIPRDQESICMDQDQLELSDSLDQSGMDFPVLLSPPRSVAVEHSHRSLTMCVDNTGDSDTGWRSGYERVLHLRSTRPLPTEHVDHSFYRVSCSSYDCEIHLQSM